MDNYFYSYNCSFTIYFVVKICYLFVMTTDYIIYIIYASITNFDIITIEDLVVFVISTKVFIQNVEIFVILLLTFLLI